MSKEHNTLASFDGWDQQLPEIDLFGETIEPVKKETQEKKEKEEDNEEQKKPEKKEEDVPVKFFEEEDEEEPHKIDDDEESAEDEDEEKPAVKVGKDEGDPPPTTISAVSYLKDKGIISFDLEEDEELSEEKAEEILEDSFDNAVEKRVEELFKDLPPIVKEINKFALNEGNVGQLLSMYARSQSSGLKEDMDMSKEENQILVMRTLLAEDDYDAETIESQIEFLKESGKLEKISKARHGKWLNRTKQERQAEVENQKQRVEQEKRNRRKKKANLSSLLDGSKDIKGLSISRTDKKDLPSYMTDKSVKLKNGRYITEMEKDLYTALNDPETSVALAKLLKSDFSFKDVTTQITKDIKKNIRRSKKTNTPNKSAGKGSQTNRRLADYF